ncbi:MAG TPA: hypothetical protein DCQ37_00700, partial [Desulfobacteraceae bacterium]|nr:hypothetical protein [Desulfobacteraceae bacterium]
MKKQIPKQSWLKPLNWVMLLGLIVFAASGCSSGGDDSSSPVIKQGQFIDTVVEGLEYETPTQSGVTDENGTFSYAEGETVTFSVGDIVIGDAPGGDTVTPVDLVEGAKDETDPEVSNITSFLLTLDDDDNPDNGITVTEDVRDAADGMSLDFDTSFSEFSTDPAVLKTISLLTALRAAGERLLVLLEEAQEHLRTTLANIGNDLDDDADGYTENQGDCDDA